ncbi:toxin-antitoxin system HicB family antitoxin [Altererythrobacter xixiisoli]|uniref:Toxin-antitoxin system HicB family antitoxin n=1 Tax=Croceibacterium xixiisoli TaxID=1476466 RepID=A0A6I4TQM4_9SPHN|nr:toxin-antitoxin system HicB family antitoxin [Croceibacterium xixiisoli]MXO97649.1 toxin-antitoxin system HicB family antitoxin [Croceibacterium xixiisoli]
MPQSDKKAFALRLDPALHAAIERLAAQDLRSVNAEIEVLLREALARRGITLAAARGARRGRPPGGGGEQA